MVYDNVRDKHTLFNEREREGRGGRGEENRDSWDLFKRSLAGGVDGSAVMAAPGDEEKDPEESQRRFSTTTRIKDNPIRLELIPWELHFSSAKY